MSEQLRTSDSTTDFHELGNNLIDTGAVALTAAEDLLEGEQLLLIIHRPGNTPEVDSRVHSLCDGIEEVRVDGERYSFDYEIDPDPPHSLGFVAIYVADWIGTESKFGFSAVTLEEGIDAIASNST